MEKYANKDSNHEISRRSFLGKSLAALVATPYLSNQLNAQENDQKDQKSRPKRFMYDAYAEIIRRKPGILERTSNDEKLVMAIPATFAEAVYDATVRVFQRGGYSNAPKPYVDINGMGRHVAIVNGNGGKLPKLDDISSTITDLANMNLPKFLREYMELFKIEQKRALEGMATIADIKEGFITLKGRLEIDGQQQFPQDKNISKFPSKAYNMHEFAQALVGMKDPPQDLKDPKFHEYLEKNRLALRGHYIDPDKKDLVHTAIIDMIPEEPIINLLGTKTKDAPNIKLRDEDISFPNTFEFIMTTK